MAHTPNIDFLNTLVPVDPALGDAAVASAILTNHNINRRERRRSRPSVKFLLPLARNLR